MVVKKTSKSDYQSIGQNSKLIAIIPAAGSGERLGLGIPKALADINGETVLTRTLKRFLCTGLFSRIVITAPEDQFSLFQESLKRAQDLANQASGSPSQKQGLEAINNLDLVAGGETRSQSIRQALKAIANESRDKALIVIHDAARVLVSTDLIKRCIDVAERSGAATAAIPVVDTLRRGSASREIAQLGQVIDRDRLWGMQTPQVFRLSVLLDAFEASEKGTLSADIVSDDPQLHYQIPSELEQLYVTDEVGLVQRLVPVEYVQGSPLNFKITTKEDLELARMLSRDQ